MRLGTPKSGVGGRFRFYSRAPFSHADTHQTLDSPDPAAPPPLPFPPARMQSRRVTAWRQRPARKQEPSNAWWATPAGRAQFQEIERESVSKSSAPARPPHTAEDFPPPAWQTPLHPAPDEFPTLVLRQTPPTQSTNNPLMVVLDEVTILCNSLKMRTVSALEMLSALSKLVQETQDASPNDVMYALNKFAAAIAA